MRKIVIKNGKVITPNGIIPNGSVIVNEGKITSIFPRHFNATGDFYEIDAKGDYISPGFIDIHVHGGGGHDFMDGEVDAFLKIAKTHAFYGCTSMVPTTLTSDTDNLLQTLNTYDKARQRDNSGAQFLGLHLEGPYFSMEQRGAQDPKFIRDPNPEEYMRVLERSDLIARWSAAPERKGALEFAKILRDNNILPAIAHTDAIYEEVLQAIKSGYSLSTHLYSGMSGVSRRNAYRYAGVIESSLLLDELDVEIIADGIHLPPALLKLIYKVKGPDKIALITDAMRGAGLKEGPSILGNKASGIPVIVEDGVAKLPDKSAFAGSVATANQLVKNMISLADIPLFEAVKMMTETPARIMSVSDKIGSLTVGKDADILVFDENIDIKNVIIKGREFYNSAEN